MSAGGAERVVSLRGDAVQVFAIRHVQANRSFDRKLKIEFETDLEHRLSFIELLGYNKTQQKKVIREYNKYIQHRGQEGNEDNII